MTKHNCKATELLRLLNETEEQERGLLLAVAVLDGQTTVDSLRVLDYMAGMVIGKCAFSATEEDGFSDYNETLERMITHHIKNLISLSKRETYNEAIFEFAQSFQFIDEKGSK